MYIYVGKGTEATEPELRDADNFRELKIEIVGAPERKRAEAALQGIGRMDGEDHAWLDQDAVAGLPGGRPEDPEWRQAFASMVEYATGAGWVDETGAIRAHIDWSDA